jgi:hypothetical protein
MTRRNCAFCIGSKVHARALGRPGGARQQRRRKNAHDASGVAFVLLPT